MKLLLVEDDPKNVKQISEGIELGCKDRGLPMVDITSAMSKEAALENIESNQYDFIILDLKIPLSDRSPDENEKHGADVFEEIKTYLPGTPVCLYSAYPTEAVIQSALDEAKQLDIWGEGEERPVYRCIRKADMDALINLVLDINNAISQLEGIEVSIGAIPAQYLDGYMNILKIFTRIHNGDAVSVKQLGKGLSSAKVLEICVTHEGESRCNSVVKLDEIGKIKKENKNYDTEINRLTNVTIPRKMNVITWGGVNKGGIFYNVAEGSKSAFDFSMVLTDSSQAKNFFESLIETFRPWLVVRETRKKIKDIRRVLLSDTEYEKIKNSFSEINFGSLDEDVEIRTRWGTCHKDMHGENIIVNDRGDLPTLIDFGDIGPGPPCLDAITLEFSFLFHPSMGRKNMSAWPTLEQAEAWEDLEQYLQGCPIENFSFECRHWANTSKTGDQEYYATVYAYIVRQLKYDTTDAELAISMLNKTIDLLNSAIER